MTWEDVLDAAEDRDGWRTCNALCSAVHEMEPKNQKSQNK